MENKKTIIVGIPAHNAAATIEQVLSAILSQELTSYDLKAIYVACDGCTDNTAEKVKNFAVKSPVVKLINDGRRVGKPGRINEFYDLSNADFFVGIDDDSVLADTKTLETILAAFKDERVALAAPLNLPAKPRTFIGRGVAAYDYFWAKATENIDGGNNVHNHISRVSIISRKLYKKIKLPAGCQADDHYLFFICIKNGFKFKFVKNAKIYFRVSEHFFDYVKQQTRWMDSTNPLHEQLGPWIEPLYVVPFSAKLRALAYTLIHMPIDMLTGILLQVTFKVIKGKYRSNSIFWTRIRLGGYKDGSKKISIYK